MKSCIYKINSVLYPDKLYIGSAVNFSKRKSIHLHWLKKGKHSNKKLQNHFNKYGINDLSFQVVEVVTDKSNLLNREQFFIDTLKPKFNILKVAGSWLGHKHTSESVKKISCSLLGNKKRLGKNHSEITKEKIRESKLNIKQTKEHIDKRSKKLLGNTWNRGKVRTPEVKKKLKGNTNAGKSIIDTKTGQVYNSVTEAAKSIGIKRTTLSMMLCGKNKNKTTLKYGNQ